MNKKKLTDYMPEAHKEAFLATYKASSKNFKSKDEFMAALLTVFFNDLVPEKDKITKKEKNKVLVQFADDKVADAFEGVI